MLPLERLPRKLWDIHPENGGMPTISGVFKPLSVDDFEKPPRGQKVSEYIEECLKIAPQILEDLPQPRWKKIVVYDWSKVQMIRRSRGDNRLYASLHYRAKKRKAVRYKETPGVSITTYPERIQKSFAKSLKQREVAIKRRRQKMIHMIGAGWHTFTPQAWVGENGLFHRFLSFYMIANPYIKNARCYHRLNGFFYGGRLGTQRTLAFKLWVALGMPSAHRMPRMAREIAFLALNVGLDESKYSHRFIKMIDAIPTRFKTPEAVWQLLAIVNAFHYKPSVRNKIIRLLAESDYETRSKIIWISSYFCPPTARSRMRNRYTTRRIIRDGVVRRRRLGRARRRARNALCDIYSLSRNSWRRAHALPGRTRDHGWHLSNPGRWANVADGCEEDEIQQVEPEKFDIKNIDEYLKLNNIEFVQRFVRSINAIWLLIHNWIPKMRSIRDSDRKIIGNLDLKLISNIFKEISSDEEYRNHVYKVVEARKEDIEIAITVSEKIIKEADDALEKIKKGVKAEDLPQYEHLNTTFQRSNDAKTRFRLQKRHALESIKRQKKELTKIPKRAEAMFKYQSTRNNFNDDMGYAAVALSLIFGSSWRGWLQRMKWRGIDTHDATFWMQPVIAPGLSEYLRQHWQASTDDLKIIVGKWNSLEPDERLLPAKQLVIEIKKKRYKNVKHEGFAAEACMAGLSENRYEEVEKKWLESIKKTKNKKDQIPDATVTVGDWTMHKLQRDDPRVAFAGAHTGCCQNVTGVAATCAWHSTSSPYGAVFAIENEKQEIVAQSWAWRNGNVIVFDSIEAKLHTRDGKTQFSVLRQIIGVYEIMAAELKKHGISEVRCGAGYHVRAPSYWTAAKKNVALPSDYPKKGYSDAKAIQYIVRFPVVMSNGTNNTITFDMKEASASASNALVSILPSASAGNLDSITAS